jgi:hypothetical protein
MIAEDSSAPVTPTPPSPTSPVAQGTALSRMWRVFYDPSAVFRELIGAPTWLLPLVTMMLVALAAQAILLPRMDWHATIRQAMQERGGQQLSDEQLDKAAEGAKKFSPFYLVLAPVSVAFILVALGGLYFLGLKALGSDADFKPVFAATVYAAWPAALVHSGLLTVIGAQRAGFTAQDIESMVKSSVASWLPAEAPKMLTAFLSVFDLFNVWNWILLVLGLVIVGRVSRGKATGIVAVLWLLWALGKTGLAALR